nr:insulinase family protein [Paraferrimonas haliotis]
MRVLLVQDTLSAQSAASLAVATGHFDDPEPYFGLAHFLEHMLFLGTERFPTAGEYQEFISQNGGSNNAWTGSEYTNYFFNVDSPALEEALDRFSQFFIAPLFAQEYIQREVQAVDSEFHLKYKDDTRRVYQVLKELVDPRHPFSKFSVGNQQTLSDEKGQLRAILVSFYQRFYSSNIMTLALVSPLSLDEQQTIVTRYFSKIPNRKHRKDYPSVPLIAEENKRIETHIEPIKEQKRLSISFSLPSINDMYTNKPLTFISHLLGNEAKGSLLSFLRKRGLANQISAGGGINGYNYKEYNISLQLTDHGLENIDEIVTATFQYINLVAQQGIEEWRYQERSALLQTAFEFQEKIKPADYASHLTINMQYYPKEDVLFGDYRMDGLQPETCTDLLRKLNPDNMRLTLIAPEIDTDRNAQWYDTPYKTMLIDNERLQKWRNAGCSNDMSLPPKNPFIVESCQVRHQQSNEINPVLVGEGPGFRLWHKKDNTFNVPKGHLFLALDSEHATKTPKHAALTRLYVEMLLDYVQEYTYPAEVAGLGFNIYPHQGGLTLHLTGITGKQEILLKLLIEKARERNFAPNRFRVIQRQLIRTWRNAQEATPISRLFTSLTATLQKRSYEPYRLAEELEEIVLDELHEHVSKFYENIYFEGLVHGDWLKEEAQNLALQLQTILGEVSKPAQETQREMIMLQGYGTLRREILSRHQDSAILIYYQAQTSDPLQVATLSLLNHAMSSSFFNELRTERQLGYMLGTGYLPLNRQPGMIFYIQSPKFGPAKLLATIDEFITNFSYAIMQLNSEQWLATKSGIINQLTEPDTNLRNRSQRYWICIGNKDVEFHHRSLVAKTIEKLTRADLIEYMNQYMRPNEADRLILYSTGELHKHETEISGGIRITNLKSFKVEANKLII